jgi:hypothetical protein
LTIARCTQTLWGVIGCGRAFPVEGRAEVARVCAEGGDSAGMACGRLGEFWLYGFGGPVDVELGLARMIESCRRGRGTESICATLAERLLDYDPAHAEPYIALACGGRAPRERMGVCDQLERDLVHPRTPVTYTIERVRGRSLAPGTRCRLWSWLGGGDQCRIDLVCGDQVVYGEELSTVRCDGGNPARGHDDETSPHDQDPAIAFDPAKLTVRDEDWEIVARAAH